MQRAKRTHKILGCTYLPCDWQDSIDAGARWYRLTRHESGMYLDERHSPRFATLEDCRQDAIAQAEYDALLSGEAEIVE